MAADGMHYGLRSGGFHEYLVIRVACAAIGLARHEKGGSMKRSWCLVAIVLMVMSTFLSSAALAGATSAGKPPKSLAPADAQSRHCVDAARARPASSWICVGSVLIADGTVHRLAPQQVARTAERADDYDSWCEYTGVCDRKINDYVMERKANIYYGYGDENVGTYDAILRINLNGRQPRYTTTLIWDGGPGIYFQRVQVACYESISWWPDEPCGTHTMGRGVYISGEGWRWTSGVVKGKWLSSSNEYYATLLARWVPTGRPPLAGQLFESPMFNCYGSDDDNCYFP
jgi:hypothetical protein